MFYDSCDYDYSYDCDYDYDYDIHEDDMIPCRFCREPSVSGICGVCGNTAIVNSDADCRFDDNPSLPNRIEGTV